MIRNEWGDPVDETGRELPDPREVADSDFTMAWTPDTPRGDDR